MKRVRKSRKAATAEAIARRAERGGDVSHFFTNTGRMMEPVRSKKQLETVVATYFTWKDLNNGKASTLAEFRATLSKYVRSKVIYVCGVMNNLLSSWEGPMALPESHAELVRSSFPPKIAEVLIKGSKDVNNTRYVFHRQQLLFVAKEAALFCGEEGVDPLKEPLLGKLGIAFLMANDHLSPIRPEGRTSEQKLLSQLVEFVLLQEYSPHRRFPHRVVRTYLMATRLMKELRGDVDFIDIPAEFEKLTGLSLLEYLALCFGALTKYMKIDRSLFRSDPGQFFLSSKYFRSTAIGLDKVTKFLDETSATAEDFRGLFKNRDSGPLDFTWFREKPLLRDGDTIYSLDTAFLAEKLETAPFWRVFASLPTSDLKDKLHAFWGKAI